MSDTIAALPAPSPGVAVEVVATFGDSVVGVRHAIDPRGGTIRATTRALLAAGALALVGAGAGFAYAAHVASANADAKARLLASGRPEWAFRPHLLPASADVGFALAAGLGLSALVWGLARRRDELASPRVRIGTAEGVDFAAPAAPAATHDLIVPAGDGFVLQPGGLAGELDGGAPIAAAVAVTEGLRARVRCGALTFHVTGVAAPRRQPAPILAGVDRRAATFLAGSALAHLAVLALIRTIPPDAESAPADLTALEDAGTRAHITSMDDPTVQRADGGGSESGADSDQPAAAVAMQLPAGTAGSDRPSPDPGRMKSTGDLSRDQAIEQARQAGILSSWDGDRLTELTGADDLTQGFDDVTAPGGLDGDGDGAPWGSFGRTRHGVGPGGGLIYAGDFHTIGGGPRGDHFGFGPPGHGCRAGMVCRGHRPVPPVVHIGHPEGAPDFSAVIRRYMKRHLPEVTYCYEKELLAKPDLAGTVTATFLLDASGQVITSSADGVDDQVDQCIAAVVKRIEFPRLAPSGSYKIRYPFILQHPEH